MQNDEFADLLWGAQAIADYIGRNYRQTVYLLHAASPVFRNEVSTRASGGWQVGSLAPFALRRCPQAHPFPLRGKPTRRRRCKARRDGASVFGLHGAHWMG